jgi:hypothetical protein
MTAAGSILCGALLLLGGCAFDLRIPDRSSDAPVADRRVHEGRLEASRDRARTPDANPDLGRPDTEARRFVWIESVGTADCSQYGLQILGGGAACPADVPLLLPVIKGQAFSAMCNGNGTPEVHAACGLPPAQVTDGDDKGGCPPWLGALVGGQCPCGGTVSGSAPSQSSWVCVCSSPAQASARCLVNASVETISGQAGKNATCKVGTLIGGGCVGTSPITSSVPAVDLNGSAILPNSWSCAFGLGQSGWSFALCLLTPW